jgi:hypothetical protein
LGEEAIQGVAIALDFKAVQASVDYGDIGPRAHKVKFADDDGLSAAMEPPTEVAEEGVPDVGVRKPCSLLCQRSRHITIPASVEVHCSVPRE